MNAIILDVDLKFALKGWHAVKINPQINLRPFIWFELNAFYSKKWLDFQSIHRFFFLIKICQVIFFPLSL